ncbi:MAG: dipeptide epimerase [Sphingomonadaceae bacterium]|uniref:dipeptide epimerase n=1 Tax=Thermaurantiacus sp. TaxID=2820283 RepID=UPI00298F3B48|nr:dipeptide epimerase [Thermaurantiacus sp.]MCS6986622.1 dipeptide epimerase [Sphingomonadaceae bacterium]MDW8414117.1 dipeptide epimerase [Thermaurantiacus sp.]
MALELVARVERFATRTPFVIARGVKRHVDVVVAEVRDGALVGCGEGTPVDYRGDTAEAARAALEALAPAVAAGLKRRDLAHHLPPGAARNALDAALLDLEAKATGRRAWQVLGAPAPPPVPTAITLPLADPGSMERAARAAAGWPVLKLKLGGQGDLERVQAVRRAAPHARLIADANQSWAGLDVEKLAHGLHALGVELLEQPLPAGADDALASVRSPLPIVADESCQTLADVDRVAGLYAGINVKLDKAGGLTAAGALVHEARRRGLFVMVGCMLATSLGLAPAVLAAAGADLADLDGPRWLARDRVPPLVFTAGCVHPPMPALWG